MNRRVLNRAVLICLLTMCVCANGALGQTSGSLELGAQAPIARIGELDATDVGIGARASWNPSPLLGVEGELNLFPSDIPDRVAISGSRLEGLFGVTVGPRFSGWRPFARVRPGFLRLGAAPAPVACILIFPPPLSCTLSDQTLFAMDVGGGVELFTPASTFIRVDVGDRMLRYPGPAIDRAFQAHGDSFFGHDVRVAVGAGWRF